MDRAAAVALLDRLHRAQNDFYAGGSADAPGDAGVTIAARRAASSA